MRKCLAVTAALIFATMAAAQDTGSVSCWVGKMKTGTPQSKRVRGSVSSSPKGTRAFISVTTMATPDGNCSNITHLYMAGSKGEFRAVYEDKAHDNSDGNGLHLVGWFGEGTKYLAETSDWTYGSEAPTVKGAVVYDEATGKVTSYDTNQALLQSFGGNCVFESSLKGVTSESLTVRVSPASPNPTGLASCVSTPKMFTISLESGEVKPAK